MPSTLRTGTTALVSYAAIFNASYKPYSINTYPYLMSESTTSITKGQLYKLL